MANRRDNAWWLLVVILTVCLQVAFVFADNRPSATGTAIDFSKAYFMLDADMEKYLCTELAGDDDETVVADYLYAMKREAERRGFDIGMVRQTIYHVETATLNQEAESATIHIAGLSRTCINPVFTYVAKLFRLGDVRTFEATLELVKEDGRWKVCGTPYDLALEG